MMKKVRDTIDGKDELTLLLEDPFGNRLVLSDEAFKEVMSKEEASVLKTGMTVFELTGLSDEELEKL